MAAMYLLKHPDHYTSHQFRVCYWRSFVTEVMQSWNDSTDIAGETKTTVVLGLKNKKKTDDGANQKTVVALSPIIDYMLNLRQFACMIR